MSNCSFRHPTRAAVFLLAIVCLAVGLTATAAMAQQAPSAAPNLGIQPADRPGSWFDLELDAGATEHLSVELANYGDEPLDVATYAADVYSLVGGGMGVALRDEATDGTTRWLDYRATTERLGANEAVRRTVTVTVPDDVEPGQYLAALVIENDQPLAAQGDLGVEHVIRQAIAVNITVPGPAAAELSIGDVEHIVAGERSVARLEIDNTGNRHLKPAGSLTLTDEVGTRVASLDVAMDSLYAGTTGHLEIGVDELLAPGLYEVVAELRDGEHDVDATGTARFEVLASPPTDRLGPGLDRVIDSIEATGLPAWLVLTAIGLLLALLLILIVVVAAGRYRSGRRPDVTAQPLVPSSTVIAVGLADTSSTVPPPPAASSHSTHTNLDAAGERDRAPHEGLGRNHEPSLNTPEGVTPRRTPPPPAAAAPSRIPTRAAQQPVVAGAPTRPGQDTNSPSSTLLFTAHPPRRRRRGSR